MQRPYFLPPWHHKGGGMPSPVSVLGRSQACAVYSLADASLQAMFLLLGYLESEHIILHEYRAKPNCFWPCCPMTNMIIILETRDHFGFIQSQHFGKWISLHDLVHTFLFIWAPEQWKNLNHTIFCVAAHSSVALLTLKLLTWKIWWAPNNASRLQMGFNSAFKGLIIALTTSLLPYYAPIL